MHAYINKYIHTCVHVYVYMHERLDETDHILYNWHNPGTLNLKRTPLASARVLQGEAASGNFGQCRCCQKDCEFVLSLVRLTMEPLYADPGYLHHSTIRASSYAPLMSYIHCQSLLNRSSATPFGGWLHCGSCQTTTEQETVRVKLST